MLKLWCNHVARAGNYNTSGGLIVCICDNSGVRTKVYNKVEKVTQQFTPLIPSILIVYLK